MKGKGLILMQNLQHSKLLSFVDALMSTHPIDRTLPFLDRHNGKVDTSFGKGEQVYPQLDTVIGRRAVILSAVALALSALSLTKERSGTSQQPVYEPEEPSDPLRCALDTDDPDFLNKYEIFLKSEPLDISQLPDQPITLGKPVYVTIEEPYRFDTKQRSFYKASLTFPDVQRPLDPILCDGRAFTMHADAAGITVPVQTLSTKKQSAQGDKPEGLLSDVKAGWFQLESFTSVNQLREMCRSMKSHTPSKTSGEKPDIVGAYDNDGSSVWFHPYVPQNTDHGRTDTEVTEMP